MINVKTVSDYIDSIAPYNTKCDWDNCGILIGNPLASVKKVGFTLDLTPETLNRSAEDNVDLVITHHPVIFKAQKSFLDGNIAFAAAQKNINIISAHTCFDCADGGVNDVLCDILGVADPVGIDCDECAVPMARIGSINEISPENFAGFVAKKLDTTVRFIEGIRPITRVAVCGGAGMSFLHEVIAAGADAYVTGDISHHEMLEAKELGITVVAAGHFETEYPAMTALKNMVASHFKELECCVIEQSNPVRFIK